MSIFSNFFGKTKDNPTGEMGFLDHVEDLRWHIIRSAVAILIGAIVVFIKIRWVFKHIILAPAQNDFISYKWFCALGRIMHYDDFCLGKITFNIQNTAVTGQFMTGLSISLMLGFVLVFPYVLWEFWKFIRPALKPSEANMATGVVFWCSLLFFIGVAFAYFIVAPYTINFFGGYKLDDGVQNNIILGNYIELLSTLILALGIVFEMPILVLFLTRIGVFTPALLRKHRRVSFLALFIISEIITPPDLFSCLLVFIPLYILYEITVLLSVRTLKQKEKRESQQDR